MKDENKTTTQSQQSTRMPYVKPILVRHGTVAGLTKAYLLRRAKWAGSVDSARSNKGHI